VEANESKTLMFVRTKNYDFSFCYLYNKGGIARKTWDLDRSFSLPYQPPLCSTCGLEERNVCCNNQQQGPPTSPRIEPKKSVGCEGCIGKI